MFKLIISFCFVYVLTGEHLSSQDFIEDINLCSEHLFKAEELSIKMDVIMFDERDLSTPIDQSTFVIVRDAKVTYIKVPDLEIIENGNEQWKIIHPSKTIVYSKIRQGENFSLDQILLTSGLDSLLEMNYSIQSEKQGSETVYSFNDKESGDFMTEIRLNSKKRRFISVTQHISTHVLVDKEYVTPVLQMDYHYDASVKSLKPQSIIRTHQGKMTLQPKFSSYELIQAEHLN